MNLDSIFILFLASVIHGLQLYFCFNLPHYIAAFHLFLKKTFSKSVFTRELNHNRKILCKLFSMLPCYLLVSYYIISIGQSTKADKITLHRA